MASRVKEDEKNERIIRGLLKLPENRRCINCNSLGPQYVCTNFWTFVCTTCSGIHREFTHRVKSVSMAKFTSQEVGTLQEGGNQRAREIYFKEWDPQRQTGPDGSNVERLRDFIKHVYVDRRYSGDRNCGKSPSAKGEREDSYENRRADTYQGGSRSPSYEDSYDRRYNDRSSPGGRSPGYDQESRQYNDYKRSPARPEIVNDWHRENRFSNGRKFEDRRMSDGESKLEGKSPERVKDPEASSPPIVRPVREILGDNVVPLRISEPPKPNVARVANGLAQTQRTASSSSLGSANGNPVEVKVETTASLIDFDAEPEPPAAVTVSQGHQTSTPQSVAQPASTSNDNNWASFDFAPEVKVSQAPSNANPLDSVLSQLSVPSSVSDHTSGIPSGSGAPIAASMGNSAILPTVSPSVASVGSASMMPFNTSAPAATPISNTTTFHPVGVSPTAPGLAPTIPNGGINEAGQWSSMQHSQPSLFPASVSQSTGQQFTPQFAAVSTTQGWNLSGTPNVQMASSAPPAGGPPVVLQPASGLTSTSASQPSTLDAKSIGRKELPADLFTATYPSFPAHYPGWQTVPPRAMGFMMQYNNAPMLMPTYSQPSKSSNPFDVVEAPVQPQAFPSLASLQGALPQMYPSAGMQRTSSLGTPLPGWMPPQSSPYPSALPSQSPSYVSVLPSQSASFASPVPPRPHTAQQVPSNMQILGHQGIGGFGSEGAALGAINRDQQMAGRFSAPPTPQPFSSVGGNPFG